MNSELPDCFICCKKPVSFHNTSDSGLNICHIICQHFWFKEDDLQSTIVCGICWEKVDQFHQFYLDVQKLHEKLEGAPPSVFIKEEEIEVEVDQLQENCIDLPVDDLKPFSIVACKLEIPEECNEQLKEELSQKPRKKRKYSRRKPGKRVVKQTKPPSRKPLTPKQRQARRQAEDNFIKQHTFYFCEECNIELETFIAMKRHQKITHNKDSVMCCGTQHRTRSFLYQHVQNVLNPEVFKCEICSVTFKYHTGYLSHKKKHDTAKKESTFKCHRCEKSCTTEETLKFHLKNHETLDNQTAKCEVCGKCFSHKRSLRVHVKTVHLKSTDFICEICSKGFYIQSKLLAHRKTHDQSAPTTTEQRQQQCPICNKWLRKGHSYLRHMQCHEEKGKDYKCEFCAHVSISLFALKVHMGRKHVPGRKKHVCNLCGKEYSQSVTLREHIANTHTGEPLYHCQYCEMKFFSNATMYKHRKKEHPQEWHEEQLAKYAPADQRKDGSDETVS